MKQTIEIDTDLLEAQQKALSAEIERISNLLALSREFCKPVSTAPELPRPIPNLQSPPANGHVRGCTPGLRRAVIMALYTGALNERELSKGLGWELARTRTVVGTMLKFRICFLNATGQLQLSDEGKRQAEWYQKNPHNLTYRPNGNGYIRQHALKGL